MVVSDEEVAALRAKLEKAKREVEAIQAKIRECETEFERLRRERSWGTSFDRQGGGNSAGRRGTAASTMGPMWTRGVCAPGGLRQSLPNFPRGTVPKFPVECSPSEYITWEQRFEFFIANQGLRHTIYLDAPEITVISCTNNAYLFGQFGEELILDHRQVWGYISEAAADTLFENSLYKCHSISDALRMMREWSLPLHPAERHLLVAEMERVQFMGDEDPKFSLPALVISRQRCVLLASRKMHQKLFSSFSASSRNVHRTPMLLSSVVVVGTGGPWESESNEGITIWYLAAVACLGSSTSRNNTGIVVVACRSSSSNGSCNTGLATVACRDSSSNSSNGLAAVGFLTSTNVGPILSLPPGKRDNHNYYSYRHGESIRQEVTGSTAGTPFQHLGLKRCPTPVSSPLRLRRLWRKRPRHQRARHRRQYLQQRRRPAVLFSPLHRWRGRPGRPLLQMKQRHRRRHRRPAVLFPRLHHLGGQSGRLSRLLERRHRMLYRRRHRRPAVLLPRLHHLGGQSGRLSRLLKRHHRTWQRRRFHWRSATTTTAAAAVTTSSAAVSAVTTTAAAAVTATTAAATTTPPQPVL